MRQPFSGTAERIFMKLSPNDRGGGECSLKRHAAATSCRHLAKVMLPPGEWRMLMLCVIYDMTLLQSPEGAT